MSLDIAIKVDPGDSLSIIAREEQGLAKVEARGKAAGESMRGVAGAFRSLGAAIEQERAALDRTTAAHDRLTRANQPLVQGFAKLGEAIQREKEMLQQIRGPAEEYAQKLQTLDSLLEKNKISTQEYAEQVANLNRQQQNAPSPSGGPSMGGALMGLAGAGALPGVLLGVGHQVEQLVHESEELEDRFLEMANKAHKFTDSLRDSNEIIDEQIQLGHELHSTGAKTIELYDGVRDATDGMNLSHQEQIRLAKTLGEASILGGKGVDAATQALQGLRVAFETGQDPGRQLRGLMKQFPDLTDHLTASLGLSKEQIVSFANDGKLSYQDFTNALISNTGDLDNVFKGLKTTNAEQRDQIAEQASVAMGRGVPAMLAQTEAGRRLYEFQQYANDGYKRDIRPVILSITNDLENQSAAYKRAEEAAREAFSDNVRALATKMGEAVDGISSAADKLAGSLAQDGFYALVKAADPWFVKPETPAKIQATAKAHLDLLAQLRAQREFDEAAKKRNGAEGREFDRIGDRGFKQQDEDDKERLATLKTIEEAEADVNKRAAELIQENGEKVQKAEEEMAQASIDAAKKTQEAWASGAGKIAGDLISAFAKGDQSVSQMVEHSIEQLAILALKMAALQMGGPGGAFLSAAVGALGGGANGFDYVANGNKLQLPGFATGGDFTVGGSGGTDSKIAMFRVTPGESVHVRTPQQREAVQASPQAPQIVQPIVSIQEDERNLVAAGLNSRRGQAAVVKVLRKMKR